MPHGMHVCIAGGHRRLSRLEENRCESGFTLGFYEALMHTVLIRLNAHHILNLTRLSNRVCTQQAAGLEYYWDFRENGGENNRLDRLFYARPPMKLNESAATGPRY